MSGKSILIAVVLLVVVVVGGAFFLLRNEKPGGIVVSPSASNGNGTVNPVPPPLGGSTPVPPPLEDPESGEGQSSPPPTPVPTPPPATPPSTISILTPKPLIDFKPGELYLNKFPGMLYENSNEPPAAHATDGIAKTANIQPINGKIVVVGLGMSNWTAELCNNSWPNCGPNSFIGKANADPSVNKTTLVLVDCAKGGQATPAWISDSAKNYTSCLNRLASKGVTKDQVQVILWLDANASPTQSLSSGTVCTSASSVDACAYARDMGKVIRYAKQFFPNTKQFFMHSRIYAGYATTKLNPEPYAYEYGFATKWVVQAQINQMKTGAVDPLVGDLSYSVAPWVAWGPYFWAAGETPRSDGLVWKKSDFGNDGTHPSGDGVKKVAGMMLNWYLTSPYSPWFRK